MFFQVEFLEGIVRYLIVENQSAISEIGTGME